jgi:cation diffusion facilitator family transporter
MNEDSSTLAERKALRFSAVGMAVMAAAGIGFALISHSEAILLDGVFSAIGMVLALLTLKVAKIVRRPDDEHFHYGYAHFTPLLNLIKSLLMIILCVFALVSAIEAVLGGGRSLALGAAVLYGIIATFACIAAAVVLHKAAKKSGSELVSVDAKTWGIDAAISGAVLLGFLAGYLVEGTSYEIYLNYLDPMIVSILVVIAIPVPLKILWNSLKETPLMMAPPTPYQARIRARIEQALHNYPIEDHRVRILKMGNTVNILVHAKPENNFRIESFNALDDIHHHVQKALDGLPDQAVLDIVFVGDMSMAD